MELALQKEAITSTYEDVEFLIKKTVHEFQKRYGGDFEELQSHAHLLFMDAWKKHNRERASFPTWCRYRVWYGLLDVLRTKMQKDNRHKQVPLSPDATAPRPWLREFLADLSNDAKMIVMLVLDTPKDIELNMRRRRRLYKEEKDRARTRRAVREFLRDIGWTKDQVRTAFTEIKEALAC